MKIKYKLENSNKQMVIKLDTSKINGDFKVTKNELLSLLYKDEFDIDSIKCLKIHDKIQDLYIEINEDYAIDILDEISIVIVLKPEYVEDINNCNNEIKNDIDDNFNALYYMLEDKVNEQFELLSSYIINFIKTLTVNIKNNKNSLNNINFDKELINLQSEYKDNAFNNKNNNNNSSSSLLEYKKTSNNDKININKESNIDISNNLLNNKTTDIVFLYSNPLISEENGKIKQLLDPVDFEKEINIMLNVFKTSNYYLNCYIEVANLENFNNYVIMKKPTILHITCHGAYQELSKDRLNEDISTNNYNESNENGYFYLYFEDNESKLLKFNVNKLRKLLNITKDTKSNSYNSVIKDSSIKLVVVSACYSKPIAEVFIDAGVPAVICIQSETKVLDESAQVFSKTFYNSILEGISVEKAFEHSKSMINIIFDVNTEYNNIKINNNYFNTTDTIEKTKENEDILFNKNNKLIETNTNKNFNDTVNMATYNNNIYKGLCCCMHKHTKFCSNNSKTSVVNLHQLHVKVCKCNYDQPHWHNKDCIYVKNYKQRFGESAIKVEVNKNIYAVCCCSPYTAHDESNKFLLLFSNEYKKSKARKTFNKNSNNSNLNKEININEHKGLVLFPVKSSEINIRNDSNTKKFNIKNKNLAFNLHYNNAIKTTLIGRNEDLYKTINFFKKEYFNRLVSISGEKGLGKTTFAKTVGQYMYERRYFEDGVVYIDNRNNNNFDVIDLINKILEILFNNDKNNFSKNFNLIDKANNKNNIYIDSIKQFCKIIYNLDILIILTDFKINNDANNLNNIKNNNNSSFNFLNLNKDNNCSNINLSNKFSSLTNLNIHQSKTNNNLNMSCNPSSMFNTNYKIINSTNKNINSINTSPRISNKQYSDNIISDINNLNIKSIPSTKVLNKLEYSSSIPIESLDIKCLNNSNANINSCNFKFKNNMLLSCRKRKNSEYKLDESVKLINNKHSFKDISNTEKCDAIDLNLKNSNHILISNYNTLTNNYSLNNIINVIEEDILNIKTIKQFISYILQNTKGPKVLFSSGFLNISKEESNISLSKLPKSACAKIIYLLAKDFLPNYLKNDKLTLANHDIISSCEGNPSKIIKICGLIRENKKFSDVEKILKESLINLDENNDNNQVLSNRMINNINSELYCDTKINNKLIDLLIIKINNNQTIKELIILLLVLPMGLYENEIYLIYNNYSNLKLEKKSINKILKDITSLIDNFDIIVLENKSKNIIEESNKDVDNTLNNFYNVTDLMDNNNNFMGFYSNKFNMKFINGISFYLNNTNVYFFKDYSIRKKLLSIIDVYADDNYNIIIKLLQFYSIFIYKILITLKQTNYVFLENKLFKKSYFINNNIQNCLNNELNTNSIMDNAKNLNKKLSNFGMKYNSNNLKTIKKTDSVKYILETLNCINNIEFTGLFYLYAWNETKDYESNPDKNYNNIRDKHNILNASANNNNFNKEDNKQLNNNYDCSILIELLSNIILPKNIVSKNTYNNNFTFFLNKDVLLKINDYELSKTINSNAINFNTYKTIEYICFNIPTMLISILNFNLNNSYFLQKDKDILDNYNLIIMNYIYNYVDYFIDIGETIKNDEITARLILIKCVYCLERIYLLNNNNFKLTKIYVNNLLDKAENIFVSKNYSKGIIETILVSNISLIRLINYSIILPNNFDDDISNLIKEIDKSYDKVFDNIKLEYNELCLNSNKNFYDSTSLSNLLILIRFFSFVINWKYSFIYYDKIYTEKHCSTQISNIKHSVYKEKQINEYINMILLFLNKIEKYNNFINSIYIKTDNKTYDNKEEVNFLSADNYINNTRLDLMKNIVKSYLISNELNKSKFYSEKTLSFIKLLTSKYFNKDINNSKNDDKLYNTEYILFEYEKDIEKLLEVTNIRIRNISNNVIHVLSAQQLYYTKSQLDKNKYIGTMNLNRNLIKNDKKFNNNTLLNSSNKTLKLFKKNNNSININYFKNNKIEDVFKYKKEIYYSAYKSKKSINTRLKEIPFKNKYKNTDYGYRKLLLLSDKSKYLNNHNVIKKSNSFNYIKAKNFSLDITSLDLNNYKSKSFSKEIINNLYNQLYYNNCNKSNISKYNSYCKFINNNNNNSNLLDTTDKNNKFFKDISPRINYLDIKPSLQLSQNLNNMSIINNKSLSKSYSQSFNSNKKYIDNLSINKSNSNNIHNIQIVAMDELSVSINTPDSKILRQQSNIKNKTKNSNKICSYYSLEGNYNEDNNLFNEDNLIKNNNSILNFNNKIKDYSCKLKLIKNNNSIFTFNDNINNNTNTPGSKLINLNKNSNLSLINKYSSKLTNNINNSVFTLNNTNNNSNSNKKKFVNFNNNIELNANSHLKRLKSNSNNISKLISNEDIYLNNSNANNLSNYQYINSNKINNVVLLNTYKYYNFNNNILNNFKKSFINYIPYDDCFSKEEIKYKINNNLNKYYNDMHSYNTNKFSNFNINNSNYDITESKSNISNTSLSNYSYYDNNYYDDNNIYNLQSLIPKKQIYFKYDYLNKNTFINTLYDNSAQILILDSLIYDYNSESLYIEDSSYMFNNKTDKVNYKEVKFKLDKKTLINILTKQNNNNIYSNNNFSVNYNCHSNKLINSSNIKAVESNKNMNEYNPSKSFYKLIVLCIPSSNKLANLFFSYYSKLDNIISFNLNRYLMSIIDMLGINIKCIMKEMIIDLIDLLIKEHDINNAVNIVNENMYNNFFKCNEGNNITSNNKNSQKNILTKLINFIDNELDIISYFLIFKCYKYLKRKRKRCKSIKLINIFSYYYKLKNNRGLSPFANKSNYCFLFDSINSNILNLAFKKFKDSNNIISIFTNSYGNNITITNRILLFANLNNKRYKKEILVNLNCFMKLLSKNKDSKTKKNSIVSLNNNIKLHESNNENSINKFNNTNNNFNFVNSKSSKSVSKYQFDISNIIDYSNNNSSYISKKNNYSNFNCTSPQDVKKKSSTNINSVKKNLLTDKTSCNEVDINNYITEKDGNLDILEDTSSNKKFFVDKDFIIYESIHINTKNNSLIEYKNNDTLNLKSNILHLNERVVENKTSNNKKDFRKTLSENNSSNYLNNFKKESNSICYKYYNLNKRIIDLNNKLNNSYIVNLYGCSNSGKTVLIEEISKYYYNRCFFKGGIIIIESKDLINYNNNLQEDIIKNNLNDSNIKQTENNLLDYNNKQNYYWVYNFILYLEKERVIVINNKTTNNVDNSLDDLDSNNLKLPSKKSDISINNIKKNNFDIITEEQIDNIIARVNGNINEKSLVFIEDIHLIFKDVYNTSKHNKYFKINQNKQILKLIELLDHINFHNICLLLVFSSCDKIIVNNDCDLLSCKSFVNNSINLINTSSNNNSVKNSVFNNLKLLNEENFALQCNNIIEYYHLDGIKVDNSIKLIYSHINRELIFDEISKYYKKLDCKDECTNQTLKSNSDKSILSFCYTNKNSKLFMSNSIILFKQYKLMYYLILKNLLLVNSNILDNTINKYTNKICVDNKLLNKLINILNSNYYLYQIDKYINIIKPKTINNTKLKRNTVLFNKNYQHNITSNLNKLYTNEFKNLIDKSNKHINSNTNIKRSNKYNKTITLNSLNTFNELKNRLNNKTNKIKNNKTNFNKSNTVNSVNAVTDNKLQYNLNNFLIRNQTKNLTLFKNEQKDKINKFKRKLNNDANIINQSLIYDIETSKILNKSCLNTKFKSETEQNRIINSINNNIKIRSYNNNKNSSNILDYSYLENSNSNLFFNSIKKINCVNNNINENNNNNSSLININSKENNNEYNFLFSNYINNDITNTYTASKLKNNKHHKVAFKSSQSINKKQNLNECKNLNNNVSINRNSILKNTYNNANNFLMKLNSNNSYNNMQYNKNYFNKSSNLINNNSNNNYDPFNSFIKYNNKNIINNNNDNNKSNDIHKDDSNTISEEENNFIKYWGKTLNHNKSINYYDRNIKTNVSTISNKNINYNISNTSNLSNKLHNSINKIYTISNKNSNEVNLLDSFKSKAFKKKNIISNCYFNNKNNSFNNYKFSNKHFKKSNTNFNENNYKNKNNISSCQKVNNYSLLNKSCNYYTNKSNNYNNIKNNNSASKHNYSKNHANNSKTNNNLLSINNVYINNTLGFKRNSKTVNHHTLKSISNQQNICNFNLTKDSDNTNILAISSKDNYLKNNLRKQSIITNDYNYKNIKNENKIGDNFSLNSNNKTKSIDKINNLSYAKNNFDSSKSNFNIINQDSEDKSSYNYIVMKTPKEDVKNNSIFNNLRKSYIGNSININFILNENSENTIIFSRKNSNYLANTITNSANLNHINYNSNIRLSKFDNKTIETASSIKLDNNTFKSSGDNFFISNKYNIDNSCNKILINKLNNDSNIEYLKNLSRNRSTFASKKSFNNQKTNLRNSTRKLTALKNVYNLESSIYNNSNQYNVAIPFTKQENENILNSSFSNIVISTPSNIDIKKNNFIQFSNDENKNKSISNPLIKISKKSSHKNLINNNFSNKNSNDNSPIQDNNQINLKYLKDQSEDKISENTIENDESNLSNVVKYNYYSTNINNNINKNYLNNKEVISKEKNNYLKTESTVNSIKNSELVNKYNSKTIIKHCFSKTGFFIKKHIYKKKTIGKINVSELDKISKFKNKSNLNSIKNSIKLINNTAICKQTYKIAKKLKSNKSLDLNKITSHFICNTNELNKTNSLKHNSFSNYSSNVLKYKDFINFRILISDKDLNLNIRIKSFDYLLNHDYNKIISNKHSSIEKKHRLNSKIYSKHKRYNKENIKFPTNNNNNKNAFKTIKRDSLNEVKSSIKDINSIDSKDLLKKNNLKSCKNVFDELNNSINISKNISNETAIFNAINNNTLENTNKFQKTKSSFKVCNNYSNKELPILDKNSNVQNLNVEGKSLFLNKLNNDISPIPNSYNKQINKKFATSDINSYTESSINKEYIEINTSFKNLQNYFSKSNNDKKLLLDNELNNFKKISIFDSPSKCNKNNNNNLNKNLLNSKKDSNINPRQVNFNNNNNNLIKNLNNYIKYNNDNNDDNEVGITLAQTEKGNNYAGFLNSNIHATKSNSKNVKYFKAENQIDKLYIKNNSQEINNKSLSINLASKLLNIQTSKTINTKNSNTSYENYFNFNSKSNIENTVISNKKTNKCNSLSKTYSNSLFCDHKISDFNNKNVSIIDNISPIQKSKNAIKNSSINCFDFFNNKNSSNIFNNQFILNEDSSITTINNIKSNILNTNEINNNKIINKDNNKFINKKTNSNNFINPSCFYSECKTDKNIANSINNIIVLEQSLNNTLNKNFSITKNDDTILFDSKVNINSNKCIDKSLKKINSNNINNNQSIYKKISSINFKKYNYNNYKTNNIGNETAKFNFSCVKEDDSNYTSNKYTFTGENCCNLLSSFRTNRFNKNINTIDSNLVIKNTINMQIESKININNNMNLNTDISTDNYVNFNNRKINKIIKKGIKGKKKLIRNK